MQLHLNTSACYTSFFYIQFFCPFYTSCSQITSRFASSHLLPGLLQPTAPPMQDEPSTRQLLSGQQNLFTTRQLTSTVREDALQPSSTFVTAKFSSTSQSIASTFPDYTTSRLLAFSTSLKVTPTSQQASSTTPQITTMNQLASSISPKVTPTSQQAFPTTPKVTTMNQLFFPPLRKILQKASHHLPTLQKPPHLLPLHRPNRFSRFQRHPVSNKLQLKWSR